MKPTELIIEYDLKSKSRKRELVYMRFILYKYFRLKGMSLSTIGKLFDRNHCTIIHGLKEYTFMNEHLDKYVDFALIKESVLTKLGIERINEFKRVEPSPLEERVLNCNGYADLVILKGHIKKEMLARENEINENLKNELL